MSVGNRIRYLFGPVNREGLCKWRPFRGRPPELQGINLLNRDAVEHRAAVCGEIFEHNAVDIRDPAKNLQYRWIRVGDWKLIVPNRERVPDGTIELYNLKSDPQEVANLATKQPDRAASLQKMLDAAWPGK